MCSSDLEHHPTGPKFGGYWKGTQKSPPKPGQGVGGGCEESIIKDLEKALVENPRANAHNLMREFQEFKESSGEFVLYINGKPAAKYSRVSDAEMDIQKVKLKAPDAKFEIKQEVCQLVSVPTKLSEAFINQLAEAFNSKQEVINHFVKQGKSAAAGAAGSAGVSGAGVSPPIGVGFKLSNSGNKGIKSGFLSKI